MDFSENKNLSIVVEIIINLGLIAISIYKLLIQPRSKRYDTLTEGIIEKIVSEQHFSNTSKLGYNRNRIFVKFRTDTQDWISKEITDTTDPPLYREGEKVTVRYSSLNPDQFIIVSRKARQINIVTILICLLILLALFYYLLYK